MIEPVGRAACTLFWQFFVEISLSAIVEQMSGQVDEQGEEDDRPWEQPGEFRRDGIPHYGEALVFAAKVGLVFNVFAWVFPPALLIAVPWSLICYVLAHNQLGEILSGYRDKRGESSTRRAEILAIRGLKIGMAAFLLWLFALWGIDGIFLWRLTRN
jgi:hypothetical protein